MDRTSKKRTLAHPVRPDLEIGAPMGQTMAGLCAAGVKDHPDTRLKWIPGKFASAIGRVYR